MARRGAQTRDRDAAEKIIDRIVSDPGYRQALLNDPVGALHTLMGLESQTADEVAGYAKTQPKPPTTPQCGNKTTCTKSCYFSCAPGGTCSQSCGYSRIAQE